MKYRNKSFNFRSFKRAFYSRAVFPKAGYITYHVSSAKGLTTAHCLIANKEPK